LWDTISNVVQPVAEAATPTLGVHNTHTPVLTAATNLDPNPAKGGGDITVVDDVALLAESGPEGTIANIEETESNGQISLYVVRKGDSLAQIAKMFGVTSNTILWANDLKSSKDIRPGDQLVILPITGVRHSVAKGETLAGIVKKYKGDMAEVLSFNGLSAGATVAVGDVVIIPDGVESASVVTIPGAAKAPTEKLHGAGGPLLVGYYLRPIIGGRKTQGLHGYNGVDLGTPVGTPVMAAADGTITVARGAGYNGGYGEYVVINHLNGTQTVYGHLSQVIVSQGQAVVQGQVIGYSGNTGKSTGAHLHFEIRGAANPF
jgi:LysM repeat protein